jgi:hypothetical protein
MAGPPVNALAIATGVVVTGGTAFGLGGGGLIASESSVWYSIPRFGNIVGWGSGQGTAAVTQQLAQTLTRETVKQMLRRGLTRSAVEEQLAVYQRALAQGGAKLANTQLLPRIELLQKILTLWP